LILDVFVWLVDRLHIAVYCRLMYLDSSLLELAEMHRL
jgi:hypothetical protein